MSKVYRRRPSASMLVAVTALIFAAAGTAVAAGHLMSGDKLIKRHSLSGNRLRNHTLTGTQINMGKLGKVPSAKNADHATSSSSATNATNATNATDAKNATNATNARNANNASNLGGQPASSYLTSGSRVGTNGIVKEAGTPSGNTVTLFTVGPFTVTMRCVKSGSSVALNLFASSTENNSMINGAQEPANTSVDLGTTGGGNPGIAPTSSPSENDNVNIDFEAPSGAAAVIPGADGVNTLGTDCWANWAGIK